MALTWDIESIKDYKDVCWIKEDEGLDEESTVRLNPVTESLIWATMSVGLGSITDKNADEFYARIAICDRLFGGFLIEDHKPAPITPEHIRAHIGLRTNVSEETRAKWMKRVVGGEMKSAAYRYRKDAEDVEQTQKRELEEAQARAEAEQAALVGATEEPESGYDQSFTQDEPEEVTPKANPFIGD